MSRRNIIILLIVFILGVGIYYYSKSKTSKHTDGMSLGFSPSTSTGATAGLSPAPYIAPPAPAVPEQNSEYSVQPIANPADLLPKDQNSQWTSLNPTINANNVIIPDLLEAGYHIGLDTIGQTLRNANLQVRSDPIIPKQEVSPWNNSTIEQDLGRVPLEVGYGCK